MTGFLDHFRKKVTSSIWKEKGKSPVDSIEVDDKIALGVLMWAVAEADEKFLPQEKDKIKAILKEFSGLSDEDISCVFKTIEITARERIDLYSFTHEVSKDLPRYLKRRIVEDLFRVACIDGDLDNQEHEMIRKISELFRLDHKEFIDAKIKVKKEFGIETIG